MQLPLNTLKSQGRAGKRNPISVDKMYSSQPSSTSLSAKRTHAIDPEVSDHEKCQKVQSVLPRRFSKRLASIFLVFTDKAIYVTFLTSNFIFPFCTTVQYLLMKM